MKKIFWLCNSLRVAKKESSTSVVVVNQPRHNHQEAWLVPMNAEGVWVHVQLWLDEIPEMESEDWNKRPKHLREMDDSAPIFCFRFFIGWW